MIVSRRDIRELSGELREGGHVGEQMCAGIVEECCMADLDRASGKCAVSRKIPRDGAESSNKGLGVLRETVSGRYKIPWAQTKDGFDTWIHGFAQQVVVRNCCGPQDEDLASTTRADRTLESGPLYTMVQRYLGKRFRNSSQEVGQTSCTSAVHGQ